MIYSELVIALQVAIIEHTDEDISENETIKGIEASNKQIQKLIKQLKKED